MRRVALDTETTGLNPLDGHRIVEIGCVELDNNIPTGKEWHTYLNPERNMPEAAQAVHGLDDKFLSNKPLFKEISTELLNFIEGAELVIHNARFDIGFLNNELKLVNLPIINMEESIDTVQLARKTMPGAAASLDALCKRFNIDLSKKQDYDFLKDKIVYEHKKPVLSPGKLGSFDDNGVVPSSIVRHGKKIYLYYIGWKPQSTTRYSLITGLAISNNSGFSFKRYSKAPILNLSDKIPLYEIKFNFSINVSIIKPVIIQIKIYLNSLYLSLIMKKCISIYKIPTAGP